MSLFLLKLSWSCFYHIKLNVFDECRRGSCLFIYPKIWLCIFALNWQFYWCNYCSEYSCLLLKLYLECSTLVSKFSHWSSMSFLKHIRSCLILSDSTAPVKIYNEMTDLCCCCIFTRTNWLIYALSDARPAQLSPEGVLSTVILSHRPQPAVRPWRVRPPPPTGKHPFHWGYP